MDWSPPGSSVHGILQARVLEWAAITFPGKHEKYPIKKNPRRQSGQKGGKVERPPVLPSSLLPRRPRSFCPSDVLNHILQHSLPAPSPFLLWEPSQGHRKLDLPQVGHVWADQTLGGCGNSYNWDSGVCFQLMGFQSSFPLAVALKLSIHSRPVFLN